MYVHVCMCTHVCTINRVCHTTCGTHDMCTTLCTLINNKNKEKFLNSIILNTLVVIGVMI